MVDEMQTEAIIELARQRGVVRAVDLKEIGAGRTLLHYMLKRGVLRKIARGVYVLSDYIPEHESFLEISAAVPHGVICLLSALQFHEITTQMPMEGWMAVERGAHVPKPRSMSLHIVKFSVQAFSAGIEEKKTDGVALRVYSPAKTVVDCFKFRNKIGLPVAREALIDSIGQKKATRDEIWHYAKLCRMTKVMRPYLEMVQ